MSGFAVQRFIYEMNQYKKAECNKQISEKLSSLITNIEQKHLQKLNSW